jgi:hypothetical protein
MFVTLGWKSLPGTNTLAYYENSKIVDKRSFKKLSPGACIIKLITAVIYGFRNKLQFLSLNTRLSWKGFPGTNTLAYNRNSKLQP